VGPTRRDSSFKTLGIPVGTTSFEKEMINTGNVRGSKEILGWNSVRMF
jgi:hypothetical protein